MGPLENMRLPETETTMAWDLTSKGVEWMPKRIFCDLDEIIVGQITLFFLDGFHFVGMLFTIGILSAA